ncbi:hypothetical protein LIER_06292 [Lithospermum erythrorhizon]|uniref:Uncharacterized protein n=1 Tax=Lithospermum erythrorhizon TaxID=34254 RepID=A0AAV3P6F5_LITER
MLLAPRTIVLYGLKEGLAPVASSRDKPCQGCYLSGQALGFLLSLRVVHSLHRRNLVWVGLYSSLADHIPQELPRGASEDTFIGFNQRLYFLRFSKFSLRFASWSCASRFFKSMSST